MLKVGSLAKKNHVYDGTLNAGKPTGPTLTVTKIKDHTPVDGAPVINGVVYLSDGTWSHPWNLTEMK